MLRHFLMSVTLAMLGLATVASAADENVMPQAKAESDAFVKAFNDHKGKAAGALFTETADFVFLQGDSWDTLEFGMVSGRDQITGVLETFFQTFPTAKLTHSVRKARLVTPDVMVSDVDFEIVGMSGNAGPIKGQSVVIRVRTGGAWKIAAERNISKVPAQKPKASGRK